MLFNSLQYVIFLPVVILFYYLIKPKYRWIMLLAASYYFYMCWRPEYIILILVSTLVDYFCAIQMDKQTKKSEKTQYLVFSILVNIGLLVTFKYLNFLTGSANAVFHKFNVLHDIPELNVLLPVGISFYTFQTLSYTIEVYQGKQKPEKHLGIFATYVAYFPQLVAGPIERFSTLGPQFRNNNAFKYENFVNGLRLILYGLFIKMVIADNISGYVDSFYKNPELYNSFDAITATLFYSFQIYSDFYGYSIIAIGSALMMGIKIMDNFRTPYLAQSINEFWQRWHISLSTWFRDYLYFPLGGNKVHISRWVINIFVVFIVSGFWHGANWTFIIWGAIHGLFYLGESVFNKYVLKGKKSKNLVFRVLNIIKTFLIVTVAWVFFRGNGLEKVKQVFLSIFSNHQTETSLNVDNKVWILLGVFILSDFVLFNKRFDKWCGKQHFVLRWFIYASLIFAIIIFAGVENFPFIYFQF